MKLARNLDGPQLVINFSPDFEIRIKCVRAQQIDRFTEHYFEVKCRIRHPSGTFDYAVDHLYFPESNFADFDKELRSIQQGHADRAALKNPGDMLTLALEQSGRRLHAKLSIREYIPPSGMAVLSLACDVDYDLFINKLIQVLGGFLTELRGVEPEVIR